MAFGEEKEKWKWSSIFYGHRKQLAGAFCFWCFNLQAHCMLTNINIVWILVELYAVCKTVKRTLGVFMLSSSFELWNNFFYRTSKPKWRRKEIWSFLIPEVLRTSQADDSDKVRTGRKWWDMMSGGIPVLILPECSLHEENWSALSFPTPIL